MTSPTCPWGEPGDASHRFGGQRMVALACSNVIVGMRNACIIRLEEGAMLCSSRRLSGFLACVLATACLAEAAAGEIKLVSDTMEKVCRVEVASGPGAPDTTAVETHTDVEKGWSITKADKLCYRRASTPGNCDSGMTQWNTRWTCVEKTGAGVTEMSLK